MVSIRYMDRHLCGGVGVPIDYQQITVGLLIVNVGATAARSLHAWIGSRETDHVDLRGIKRMIDQANQRGSEKHGETLRRIYALEASVTRLNALEEARHFHARKDDST